MNRKKPAANYTNSPNKNTKSLCSFVFLCGLFSLICAVVWLYLNPTQNVAAEDANSAIEKATFTKQSFFGAEANVPLPTVEARENLALVAADLPENPQILAKLAEFDEKLERYDEAEKSLIRLSEIVSTENETLAAFYRRRGAFEKEAEVLRKMLFTAEPENRAAVFERLIDTARLHDLTQYLQADFYELVTKENPDAYEIFRKLSEKLVEEKNYPEALKFVRQAKRMFPDKRKATLTAEIEILLATDQANEAESVYTAAFDPFWAADEAEKFYDFLSRQDRLREYGAELNAKFKRNPADFETGVRLALFQNHDYRYGNDEIAPIIARIEAAKKDWTTDELVTATRLLLQQNEGETASRFLYTLYLREDFQKNPKQRGAILYQLFEMFSDAGNQKLPLTKGDLRFYEDVAKSDRSPGITTGILSLIFSDTNPRRRLEEQETAATQQFNRAAAYRIFEEYKKEPATSDELAQMYLDIVRLYTAARETEIAGKTLDEFNGRFANSSDFPNAAMKLADAFSAVNQESKARETYQKVLDFLGAQNKPLAPKKVADDDFSSSGRTEKFEISNAGINVPKPSSTPKNEYYDDSSAGNFRDFLGREPVVTTYADVLEKLVGSLAKEKKTAEILALYSDEIAKYPSEEWIYEKRLTWLEQTNLTEEKLQFYKTSLARFQTNNWRDKLARFFIRQERNAEFAEMSQDLVGKLNDAEIQNYLSQMIGGKMSAGEFEKYLYLKLYLAAHARFPRNPAFVNGLLSFYKAHGQEDEWRKLSAEYYFESPNIRESYLNRLAEKGELRHYLQQAQNGENAIYELFRADASARLSDFENAVAAYRKLNQSYPHEPIFSERLLAFTRSFGQKNPASLIEAAEISQAQANFQMNSAAQRTRSGEIYAELGLYEKSGAEWEKLIATAKGSREVYLDTATIYWDYYQFDDALRTIENLREKFRNTTLFAFEAGAILESRRKKDEAIGEYVKAFDANGDEEQKENAKNRLTTLANGKTEMRRTIDAAFEVEKRRRENSAFLSLGYAEFLAGMKQTEQAAAILNRAIAQSRDTEFLDAAKSFYQIENNRRGEQIALKRLAETSQSLRRAIRFKLQLAESYEANDERAAAKNVLANLVEKFPTNYGVLTETSNFYRRLGDEMQAARVLQNALPRSRGFYRTAIAQTLARRLIQTNQLGSAERILLKLHDEDASNADIFRELTGVLVRTGKPDAMRKAFDQTVKAIKSGDEDRRETDDRIAELRAAMIDAFTRLKDYDSAVEQHIEIINREPENERLTENAVAYVRRYGGAEKLTDYYLKTAAEAFKNYRWNVVLARIYEANDDWENAAKNYRAAIVNQPEMVELYAALAETDMRRSDYDQALRNLDVILELTNDDASYVKKKIEILKKAGRLAEIAAEKAKLPAEAEKKIVADEFAEARQMAVSEKEKAREIYRQAFAKLSENPLHGELKESDVFGYVEAVRAEEPLDQINEKLWDLRGKLIALAEKSNSADAGEARRRLIVVQNALTESIGSIAAKFGTDAELAALHENLNGKIEDVSLSQDKNQTISLIQNLSRRAGFGDLEEKILIKKAAAPNSAEDKRFHLQTLVNFYNERGAYQKTFDALEKYASENLPLKAETARLVGNREKELEALRTLYWKPFDEIVVTNDANTTRYLEVLYAENRVELSSLADKSSARQLQLINFLLGKGEREAAHRAIANSGLSQAWIVSRHAETSLALREFDEAAECFFCDALQFVSIGEMVASAPDKTRFLINDDWFRLTREYGEWLGEKDGWQNVEAQRYLTAMIENQPRNADEQFKLGVFYLDKNDPRKAVEHFRLAAETSEFGAENIFVNLGAALYLAGEKDAAEETWKQVFAGEENDQIKSGLLYFQTLRKYNLTAQAREKMPPLIVEFLENNNADQSEEFQELIRSIAASFSDETEKSAYFRRITRARPTDVSLAAMLVGENLIARNRQKEFYELLIKRSDGLRSYDSDYKFEAVRQRIWTNDDAESVYRQESDYQTAEPDDERNGWRKKYLELLFELNEDSEAARLIAEIEKDLNDRYARPAWLGLANIRRQVRDGKTDLTEIEKFVGIAVSDSAAEIKPPSVERFNEVLRVLNEEKKEETARQISESFFARMLALGQFDAANFNGLARVFFQAGETEKALRMLRLMVEAGDETQKETAAAELAAMEIIKSKAADATKLPPTRKVLIYRADALRLAAEIAAEFQSADAAIAFRRQLFEAHPADGGNTIGLAKMLLIKGETANATEFLTRIINDRNSPRSTRWQARAILKAEIPDQFYDSFSQFYRGKNAAAADQNDAAINFYINSLIADKTAESFVRQNLIGAYALENKFFAALKLAENDSSAKSDELLRTLSAAAEKVGDFQKAIEYERAQSGGGSAARATELQNNWNEQYKRATDFTVDLENTKKL